MSDIEARSIRETKLKVVGTRPLRPDGVDKVTGRARFGADYSLPGMLWGRILRWPHAHARIRSIDTSKARGAARRQGGRHPRRLPDSRSGPDRRIGDMPRNVMAREKVLYDGHAVAAVAAISASIARQALKLIKVDYEVLPHVTDVDEAMKPDAPLLHDDMITQGVEPAPKKASNIAERIEFGHGDLGGGLRRRPT